MNQLRHSNYMQYHSYLHLLIVLFDILPQFVNVIGNLLAYSMNHFSCSYIRFHVNLKISVHVQVFPVLFKTTDTEQFTLFFSQIRTGSAFGTDADLPMTRIAIVMIFDVVEKSGLQQHELLEFELMDSQIRMNDFNDSIIYNRGAKSIISFLAIDQLSVVVIRTWKLIADHKFETRHSLNIFYSHLGFYTSC